jgi:hypothetical protein
MESIEELKLKEKEAMTALSVVRSDIRAYWLSKHKEDFGVEPGVIVLTRDNKKAIVDSVEAKEAYRKPWLQGRVEKKDGSFGKAVRNLYSDWKVIKEV